MVTPFQDAFPTTAIPLPDAYVQALAQEVPYPYPSQVTVIGSLFPVPVPATSWERMDGKVERDENGALYIKQSRNLLVCFPTSAGKTFLIKLFLLKHLDNGTNFYTVPLKSLADEKHDEFTKQFPGLKIGIMTGDYQHMLKATVSSYDIIITTYEKLDSLLRNSLELMQEIVSCIVIDEIHELGSDRGKCIENFVMKLKMIGDVPIMATSATVGNASQIARWLDADLFVSKFRPVPLKKGVLVDGEIEYDDGSFERYARTVEGTASLEDIITKKLEAGDQIMYVRATRDHASSFAKKMSLLVGDAYKDDGLVLPHAKTKDEQALSKCIRRGIACHHAGLRSENRTYIEKMFKKGRIKFLCATTTLAAGVNLPSRVVLLDWRRFSKESGGQEPLPVMEVLQILGRAGRPQYDSIGYGILVCKNDREYEYCMDTYLTLPPEQINSPLLDSGNLFHSLLGNIGTASVTAEDLLTYYSYSFGYCQDKDRMIKKVIKTMSSFEKFPEPMVSVTNDAYRLTPIGKIVKQYYVDPDDASIIIEMIRDCKALSTLSVVHAIMKCHAGAPLSVRGRSGWEEAIEDARDKLYYDDLDVNDREQVREIQTALILVGTGQPGETIYADESVSFDKLCERYGIEGGDIQRLVGPGGKIFWLLQFASRVAKYYRKVEIARLIDIITIRLRYGVSTKIVPLCSIDNVGRERGKALYRAGYTTVASVASAGTAMISKVDVNGKLLGDDLASKIVKDAIAIINARKRAEVM